MARSNQEATDIATKRHGDQNSSIFHQLVAVYRQVKDWACDNCSKTGIIIKILDGCVKTTPCICVSLKKRSDTIVGLRSASGIPFQYSNAKLNSWVNMGVDERQRNLNKDGISILSAYSKNIKKMITNGYGIYLTGMNGVGKTYLACAIGNHAIACGYSVRFLTMAAIIQNEIRGWRDEESASVAEECRNSDLLIIDDIDKVYKTRTGIEISLFDNILRSRVQSKKPCIFTSNRTIQDAAADYGIHIMSMLLEHCAEIVLVGSDYRGLISDKIKGDILNGS